MVISIITLELETTDNLVQFDDALILKTMKTGNCQFLGTKIAQEDTEKMR